DKDEKEDHDAPHGGMHTGGGALTVLGQDGGREHGQGKEHGGQDSSAGQEENSGNGEEKGEKEEKEEKEASGGWKGKHDKPDGGMHTGGGALAGPSLTAGALPGPFRAVGGLGALALAGTGLYALRRRKTAGNVA
ncbi:hypothetical protein ABT273_39305, partial [Streptomyces humidus]